MFVWSPCGKICSAGGAWAPQPAAQKNLASPWMYLPIFKEKMSVYMWINWMNLQHDYKKGPKFISVTQFRHSSSGNLYFFEGNGNG